MPPLRSEGSYAGQLLAAILDTTDAQAQGDQKPAASEGRDHLLRPDCRVDATIIDRHWDRLLQPGDALARIQAVEQALGLFDFGAFPAAVITARTRRRALELLSRYIRLLSDLIAIDLVLDNNVALLRLRNTPKLHWASQLLLVLLVRRFGRDLLRRDLVLHGLLLHFPDQGFGPALESGLGTSVIFDAGCTGLILEPDELDSPLPRYSESTHQALLALAERKLEAMDSPLGLRVKDAIGELLQAGQPVSADLVAERLRTSSRTLQRRLQESGRSLSTYLDEVRTERAKQLLITSHTPIGLIAQQVGFQYQASFNKFFARQTGMSPRQYRQEQGSLPRR